jgi:hypothetical protein
VAGRQQHRHVGVPAENIVVGVLVAARARERPAQVEVIRVREAVEDDLAGGVSFTTPLSYAFTATKLIDTTQALVLGSIASGTVQPFQKKTYTFTLASATQILVDDVSDSFSSGTLALTGPRGQEFSNRNSGIADVSNLPAGNYSLTVTGSQFSPTNFSFRVLDLGAAPTLSFNTPVSGVLDPSNSINAYRFNGSVGDRLYVDPLVFSTVDTIRWRLVDQFGKDVTSGILDTNFSGDVPLLTNTGPYTLILAGDPTGRPPINYTFNVHKVVDTTQTLPLNTVINGNITQPGEYDTYTFDLAAPTKYERVGAGDRQRGKIEVSERKSLCNLFAERIDQSPSRRETARRISQIDKKVVALRRIELVQRQGVAGVEGAGDRAVEGERRRGREIVQTEGIAAGARAERGDA